MIIIMRELILENIAAENHLCKTFSETKHLAKEKMLDETNLGTGCCQLSRDCPTKFCLGHFNRLFLKISGLTMRPTLHLRDHNEAIALRNVKHQVIWAF